MTGQVAALGLSFSGPELGFLTASVPRGCGEGSEGGRWQVPRPSPQHVQPFSSVCGLFPVNPVKGRVEEAAPPEAPRPRAAGGSRDGEGGGLASLVRGRLDPEQKRLSQAGTFPGMRARCSWPRLTLDVAPPAEGRGSVGRGVRRWGSSEATCLSTCQQDALLQINHSFPERKEHGGFVWSQTHDTCVVEPFLLPSLLTPSAQRLFRRRLCSSPTPDAGRGSSRPVRF